MKHDLEQRLKRLRSVPAPESLDRRMEALFDEAAQGAAGQDLEQRLERIRRVPVPEVLDRRMETLFDNAGQDAAIRRPWRLPVWAAAAAGLILVVSFFIRGGFGPEPLVVEITPDGQLELFLLGGEQAVPADLGIFTRGECKVETVWPVDAPGMDRQPINGSITNGER